MQLNLPVSPERGARLLIVATKMAKRSRRETAVHAAADAHVETIKTIIEQAFAAGRQVMDISQTPASFAKAASRAVRETLESSLQPALHVVLAAGGDAGIQITNRIRAAAKGDKASFVMRFDSASPEAIAWADRHAGELIDGITETTREEISNAIAEALESGDLRGAFDDILAAVGDPDRAELIARTETMTAANEGQRQAWDQMVERGLLPEDAKRVWIATEDACDEICEGLDGQQADLDGEYEHPDSGETFDGPPAHPRCRCTEGING